jgi:hypothetical protein
VDGAAALRARRGDDDVERRLAVVLEEAGDGRGLGHARVRARDERGDERDREPAPDGEMTVHGGPPGRI